VIVVIAGLGQAGVSTAPFVAVIGAAGLAVDFALQGSLSNFAAGVMIIFFRPFRVGDVIEGGGTLGAVEEIQVFATILKTADNKRIIVPNSALTSGNIINYSANPNRRVDLVFGIGYDDDMAKAKGIAMEILARHPLVLKDPAPEVVVGQLADSSVNLYVRPWVRNADYWATYFDLIESIKGAFDKQGITIPFPQRDVHLHQVA
jgi:small conductance mechanosensitive channel